MPNALNPLEQIARRWQPSERFVRRAAAWSVVMAVVIIVTGGAVRLTQSGLGCPTWPKCTSESLGPTDEMGINGLIEFGNRLLTYVLCAVVGLVIVAARSRTPVRRDLTRLAWAQFWLIAGNAIVGGITVLTGLNPYIVSAHFLLSTALITVAVFNWQRAREGDAPPRYLVPRAVRQLSLVLVGATAMLTAVGTVVTGSGPHAGDAKKVTRIPLEWQEITQLHVDFVYIVVGLTIALWFTLRALGAGRTPLRVVGELFAMLMVQGVVGYVQYFTHLPEVVVGIHLLGSALVWVCALRVYLVLRVRDELPATPADGGEQDAVIAPQPGGEPSATATEAPAASR